MVMAEGENEKHLSSKEDAKVAEPEEAVAAMKKLKVRETRKTQNPTSNGAPSSKFKRLLNVYWAKKKVTVPLTVLTLLLVIFAIPVTRYDTLGLFLKKSVTVSVVDSKTGTP